MADREISTETVAAAERLAAVDYTPAERSQMLGKLDEHVGRARARRAFEPANGLGPAVVFDPRLPGVALAGGQAWMGIWDPLGRDGPGEAIWYYAGSMFSSAVPATMPTVVSTCRSSFPKTPIERTVST